MLKNSFVTSKLHKYKWKGITGIYYWLLPSGAHFFSIPQKFFSMHVSVLKSFTNFFWQRKMKVWDPKWEYGVWKLCINDLKGYVTYVGC